ncbi:MAG TPA: cysteine methyltransferase [Bacteroidales bacterium]|nr:cysteine methyltransferase [Bacteroidales bacterium]
MENENFVVYIESPLGTLELTSTETELISLYFNKTKGENSANAPEVLQSAVKQLKEYFEGKRQNFELKLAPKGTEFQRKVWNELLNIPYGTTISYIELANRLNNPKAVRAVGTANGSNPISIFIPCHRVIGSNGKLVGYGGGLANKQILLEIEHKNSEPGLF